MHTVGNTTQLGAKPPHRLGGYPALTESGQEPNLVPKSQLFSGLRIVCYRAITSRQETGGQGSGTKRNGLARQ
jgi:hypothetical protein